MQAADAPERNKTAQAWEQQNTSAASEALSDFPTIAAQAWEQQDDVRRIMRHFLTSGHRNTHRTCRDTAERFRRAAIAYPHGAPPEISQDTSLSFRIEVANAVRDAEPAADRFGFGLVATGNVNETRISDYVSAGSQ